MVDSVAHQPTDFGKVTLVIYRGNSMARREVNQLDTPAGEKGVIANEQGVRSLAHKSCEGCIDLAAGACIEELDLQTDGASSRFHVSLVGLGNRSRQASRSRRKSSTTASN
jgi:hypothetical protein